MLKTMKCQEIMEKDGCKPETEDEGDIPSPSNKFPPWSLLFPLMPPSTCHLRRLSLQNIHESLFGATGVKKNSQEFPS